jgi:hypothetical protein
MVLARNTALSQSHATADSNVWPAGSYPLLALTDGVPTGNSALPLSSAQ